MLASGSRGNAIYISDGETSLLIDAGLSGIELERRLAGRGIDPASLDAIVISHEHNDHILGAGVLSRRFNLPVYITRETARAAMPKLKKIETLQYFERSRDFAINRWRIHPFCLSHDAVDPVGFTFCCGDKKIGLATDLGVAPAMVREHLKDCGILVVEANHDPVMLTEGPYPWPVKQRIKSRTGHLSNDDSRALLGRLKHPGLTHVVLAHLSLENNTCEKALSAAADVLNDTRATLSVARQDCCGEWLCL